MKIMDKLSCIKEHCHDFHPDGCWISITTLKRDASIPCVAIRGTCWPRRPSRSILTLWETLIHTLESLKDVEVPFHMILLPRVVVVERVNRPRDRVVK